MTAIDMTGASDAEFRARIAPFESDERQETVARALWAATHGSGVPWSHAEFRAEDDHYRRLAAAAIAALPPSPAEEAVKPGLNAESNGRRLAWFTDDELSLELTRRAALASPAPAPQGGA